MKFYIYFIDNSRTWEQWDEGPWDTANEAVAFAKHEMGVPWCVMSDDAANVVTVGDVFGQLKPTQ